MAMMSDAKVKMNVKMEGKGDEGGNGNVGVDKSKSDGVKSEDGGKRDVKKEDGLDQQDQQDDLDALEGLESEAKEFMKDTEIDRILKAFRLDAYAVLDLQPGVGESDIKKCYRVKSLLIHPDKTRNPLAPDAFDRLKKAQIELMDEKHRERLDESIADARMLVMREKGLNRDSPEVKEPSEEFRKAWREKRYICSGRKAEEKGGGEEGVEEGGAGVEGRRERRLNLGLGVVCVCACGFGFRLRVYWDLAMGMEM
ncbi:06c566a7-2c53-4101-abc1-ff69de2f4ba6 [Sclerotinia trifoliorum]|uniref:06c566a7-2c53-4101-abc1-ff69de2f4ba6 n=1 Tax=Sclerotinia trifoliorum TaxID=28548 RepID=A0A8H2W3A3_9HELO|nr:06c566a7-2c53-4101-abc1-ff69de2f4ba6 [Sclerotinia trifoliorum]